MFINNLEINRNINCSFSLGLVFCYLLGFVFITPVQGQVIPDDSLGNEKSIITPQDAISNLIEGGATRDNNLFHSFSEFNVNEGARVDFANPDGIANILTRVTGNNISEIFGILGVNGGANLFLLNPNGIIFGENATLDISGSFLATTAESYIFDNGFEYSATNPEIPPLLTINIPIGLQMGNNPGKIKVEDSGHGIDRQNELVPFINLNLANGLRVQSGQTLSLIGGEIELNGGNLIAPDGKIQLGSIAQGKVGLNPNDSHWSIDYTEVVKFQDINLWDKALIDVSGINSGSIHLRGDNITLDDGSVINHIGFNFGGKISIEAEELITVRGIVPNSFNHSAITSADFGIEQGASIKLKSENLVVADGGVIAAYSNNLGRGGDVTIEVADSVVVTGLSNISTTGLNWGDGGNLTLNANQVEILVGATVTSSVFGTGLGGDIKINAAESLTVKNIDLETLVPSEISSITFNQGNAGNVEVNTRKLVVQNGGGVDSITFAQGNAGILTINALESVEVSGAFPSPENPILSGSINSSAIVNAVPLIQELFDLPPIPTGDAGGLILNTPQLKVVDGARVAVRNDGLGNAGNLNIDTESILIESGGKIAASTESGHGGNLNLDVPGLLILRDHSLISAEAQESGNGGNILINSEAIAILDQSSITANAFKGDGGNIDITTKGLFVSPNSLVSASSQFGLDGNINIDYLDSDRLLEFNQLPDNFIDRSQEIIASCSRDSNNFSIAGQGGLPENPRQYLRGQTVWQDLRFLSNNHPQLTNNSSAFKSPQSSIIIEAKTWKINQQGNIELLAQIPISNRSDFSQNNYQCQHEKSL